MDQIKIGKYIAGKRKSLGYTQVQLAEKLGMINVAKDGKKRNRKLKKIILVFAGMAIALAAVLIGVLYSEGYFLQNYVKAYPSDSVERATAQMLTGTEGAFLYEYSVDDKYDWIQIEMVTYYSGTKVEETEIVEFWFAEDEKRKGILSIVPQLNTGKIAIVVTAEMSKMSTEVETDNSILEEYYAYSNTEISEKMEVSQGKSEGILALFYDEGHMQVPMIENIESNPETDLAEDDVCYYFTVSFGKE